MSQDNPKEIVSTRVVNFPREKVFQAWTDPDQLKNWWGPKGFKNTFEVFDQRPGGEWKFIMHGPDGTDYPNRSVFQEIVKPEKIVFDHLSGPIFKVTTTFESIGEKTKLVFRMLFETAEECEQIKVYAVDGNEQNFDRLEELLAKV
ncbi:SRPBCC family protein [Leptospira neocaledonica]|uniref:Polyketide cyclase n=1 Tax=Leptospira neocaledonica TaxID=2023192 RepID=A0A2M9ZW23_9LEPT|nr:SRPBCC family protein [Leptospira neocaledonica]PJZ76262.1 polyketide cyclase [Leptospira neocaledonica]